MDKKELTVEELNKIISDRYTEYFKKYEDEMKNAMMDAIIFGRGIIEYTDSAEIRHVPYDPFELDNSYDGVD